MGKFIERMEPLEALQWTGKNYPDIAALVGIETAIYQTGALFLKTYGGRRAVNVGDWVFKEANGQVETESNDDFIALYMPWPPKLGDTP